MRVLARQYRRFWRTVVHWPWAGVLMLGLLLAHIPAHPAAAVADATVQQCTEAGLDADLGPFGTSVEGDDRVLLPALGNVLAAALASGATRVTLQLERIDGEGATP